MKIENNILIPEIARLLNEGKEVRFTPSGVSMRPFIEGDRDSVILAKLNRPPRVGDILLVEVQTLCGKKTYVLHRLIRMDGEVCVLQGDGNLSGEEQCCSGDIIGYVLRIENPQGRSKYFSRGRLWYYLRPLRKWLLKIYRHSVVKWLYG